PSPPANDAGGGATTTHVGPGEVGGGHNASLVFYEPGTNRPRAEITVADWNPTGTSSDEMRLVKPVMRIRTPDGQGVRVMADEGWITTARDDAGRRTLNRGRFVGGVNVDVDRRTPEQIAMLPAEERDLPPAADHVIHVKFRDFDFDIDQGRGQADGPFELAMAEGTLTGVGLTFRYNDVNRRVESLNITKLGELVLHSGLARRLFDDVIPGRSTVTDPAIATDGDAAADAAFSSSDTAAAPRGAPDVMTPAEALVGPPNATDEPTGGWPVQTYVVDITPNVRVRQTAGAEQVWSIEAPRLSLLFDFGPAQRELARHGRFPTATDNATDTPADSTDGAVAPESSAASGEQKLVLTCDGGLSLRPLRETGGNGSIGERMRLTADGGGVRFTDGQANINCTRLEAHKETGRLWIAGTPGEPLRVQTIQCAELAATELYADRSAGVVEITGPARMTVADETAPAGDSGARPSAGVDVRFDTHAKLKLATHELLRIHPTTNEVIRTKIEYIADAVFVGRASLSRGDEFLAGDEIAVAIGPPVSPDAPAENIQSVRAAGNVIVHRAAERLTGRDLTLLFGLDPSGQAMPRFAEAAGDVVFSQGERVVTADDHVTVEMTSVVRQKPPFDMVQARVDAFRAGRDLTRIDFEEMRRAHERGIEYTVGVQSIRAAGNVTAVDPRDALDVRAASFSAAFVDGRELRSAIIEGPDGGDAHAGFRDLAVSAHRIDADLSDESVEVLGAGSMSLVARRGLEGGADETPRRITMAWKKQMTYERNHARFVGGVHAVTTLLPAQSTGWDAWFPPAAAAAHETSTFDAAEMTIEFADAEAPTEAAAVDATMRHWGFFAPLARRWTKAPATMPLASFKKDPVYLLANRNVVGVFTETAGDGATVRSRVRIAGDTLAVDLRSRLLTIPTPGDLLIEDYRAVAGETPASGAAGDSAAPVDGRVIAMTGIAPPGGGSDAAGPGNQPSQTYLKWAESMSFHFGWRRAEFNRDVSLAHRSGEQILFAGALLGDRANHAGGDRGRNLRLTCQEKLLVEFQEGAGKPGVGGAGRMSARDISALAATGGVYYEDDAYSITAQRVEKFAQSNLLRVYGHDGQVAEIYGRRPGTPRFQGAEFNYNLVTGEIEAKGGHSVGVRR
ncbi:MAG: hypothetical protein HOP29_18765, partial [Phycisphaerales bacterium]|nr:hypothetical protein [Phycisphaerales bacterium]